MKILIVDDSKPIRETILQNIKHENDIIYEREDGDEALEAYQKYLPDWVLMDLKMKRVGGLTATQEIKKHFPEAKIAIITSFDSKVFKKAAEKAGADCFFSKKNLTELYEQLHSENRNGN